MAGGTRPKDRSSGSGSRKRDGKGDRDGAGDEQGAVRSATLHAVAGDTARRSASAVPQSQQRPAGPVARGRSRVSGMGAVGALAAALAVVSLLLAYQYQRASELGDQVEGLRGALETARGELGIHRERMALVKGHVDDLSARVGALAELVADDRAGASGSGSESDEPSE